MSPPQNARPSLHTRRTLPSHTRSIKPPPLTSKKSSNPSAPSRKSPTSKSSPGWNRHNTKSEVEMDTEEDDMAGLPQFCATCEKQIVTPNNSILYCSESCRKEDDNKPLQQSVSPHEIFSQPSSRRTSYYGDDESPSIRSPFAVRPPSLAFSDSSDSSSFYDRRSSYMSNDSEAAHYLSQFLPSDPGAEHGSHASFHRARPSTSHSIAPSLSHTPTSLVSTSGSYRPLPRRGDPFSASFSSFSVDLITPVNIGSHTTPPSPHVRNASVGSTDSTDTAFRIADREMNYEKKTFSPEATITPGSLRQLFSHKAMQSLPRQSVKEAQFSASAEQDPTNVAGCSKDS